jgi:enoyl-CoA hydratase / 3-hydroxyacyl-CoA dehydrogenase
LSARPVPEARAISSVAVLGAGTMGHGIAEVAALAGYKVVLYDVERRFLDSGMEKIRWSLGKLAERGVVTGAKAEEAAAGIACTTELEDAARCDIVVEAAPESLELKKSLFGRLDALSKRSLLASNTSSIPITEIAAATGRPGDVVGVHFFNPPVMMPLVEVVRGAKTTDDSVRIAVAFCKSLGKRVVVCEKDVPGFIVNRIIGPMINEAAWVVARGEATIRQVDSCCVYKVGLPMGLFELADYTGIDVIFAASQTMKAREPASILVAPALGQMAKEGKLGRKTGEGFYGYSAGGGASYAKAEGDPLDPLLLFSVGINSAAWLLRNEVCSRDDLDASVKLGLGFPEGILQLADSWGIDRVVAVLRKKQAAHGDAYAPDPLLVKMQERGELGVSSGRGFYDHGSRETKLEEIVLKKAAPVAWITLNRPHRHNTITPKMMDELEAVANDLAKDRSVRVVVISGEGGKAFSAGADLTAFEFTSPLKAFESARRMFEVFTLFEKMPKPVVAAINGYAFGGGCELALACDFRLASESSQIGLTETNLGIIPGAGGTQRLLRLVGLSKAKEMIYFGERLQAQDALKLGLLDRVFANEGFQAEVEAFARRLAKRAPISLKLAKYAINLALQVPADAGQLFEAGGFGLTLSTQDASEGISSFLSKKEPEFKGE